MNPLTPAERRTLRAKAHHLDPVVSIGQHGLTPAVLHEIEIALIKHELVKIRVFSDDREIRETTLSEVVTAMDCAPIQHVGKVLVVWRPNPELRKKALAPTPVARPRKRPGKLAGVKKTGPRAPIDPVRERRRTARADEDAPLTGKGRRGAARHELPRDGVANPFGPPRDADTARRKATGADTTRRKSSYTPKTKPKSFSAKPNPRSAWAKSPPGSGSPRPASGVTRPAAKGASAAAASRPPKPMTSGTRRRRTTG